MGDGCPGTRADVTDLTLRSEGFYAYAYANASPVFSRANTVFNSSTGYYSAVSRFWPSSGAAYSFVAVSKNLPNELFCEGDVDGDGKADYAFDINDASCELDSDVVVAYSNESFRSVVVPLSFRHVYSKLSGICVKAQNVTGASVRLKQVELTQAGSARMHILSRDGLKWQINECACADSLAQDDAIPEDVLPDGVKSAAPDMGSHFPYCSLYSGNAFAGSVAELNLNVNPRYLVPTDCILPDGVFFQDGVLRMTIRVRYDAYVNGVLTEEDKVREQGVLFCRGVNYLLHLTLPVQSLPGLSCVVEAVGWESGVNYNEPI